MTDQDTVAQCVTMECNYCYAFTYDVCLHVTLHVTWRQKDVNIRPRIAEVKIKSPRLSGDINVRVLIHSIMGTQTERFSGSRGNKAHENIAIL